MSLCMCWKMLHLQAMPMISKIKKYAGCCLSGLVLLSLSGFLSSCSQGRDERKELPVVDTTASATVPVLTAEEQLYQEVMDLHDRAMERMSLIRRLSRQLSDSIEHTGVNPMEQEEAINRYRNRLQELNEADEAMRQWMRSFDYQDVAEEEQLAYLQQEKEKIEKVDRQINEAIANAREAMQE